MEQLPKILYLTEDDKGLKLRRRVPKELRAIVGQSEWVERCSGLRWGEIKQRASLFAVRTDAKLKEARAQLARTQTVQGAADGAPGFKIRPSMHDVEQIALAYFHERSRDQGDQRDRHIDFDSDEHREAMEEAGLILREAELSAEGKSFDPREDRSTYYHRDAVDLLTRYGYLTERAENDESALADEKVVSDPAFAQLVKLIGKAEVELALRVYKARETQQEPPVTDPFFSAMVLPGADPKPAAGQKGHSLEELVRSFLAHKSREVGSSRLSQFNVPMRALTEELGPSFRVADVTRAHCQELADLLVRVPSHATQHYKGLRLRDAAEAHKRKHGTYPSRFDEAEKGLAALKMAMEWAVDQEWVEANPAAKVKVVRPARPPKKFEEAEDDGYEPFSDDELQAIFTAPLFTGSQGDGHRFAVPGPTVHRRSRYWVPLIAVWSGMRLNEILQLKRGDIKRQDGIAYFDVTDREELEYDPTIFSKRLKNTHSVRKVPVHAQLVRLGLLEWVDQSPSGRLFAEATGPISERPSLLFSKRFQTFLRSRKVSDCRFASFVRDVAELKEAGVVFEMTPEHFALVNPNSRTAPIYRAGRDKDISSSVYGRLPILVDKSAEQERPVYPVRYLRMFDMANDSGLFRTRSELEEREGAFAVGSNRFRDADGDWVPLYEGKMVQAFDHRASSVVTVSANVHRPGQGLRATLQDHQNPDFVPEPRYYVRDPGGLRVEIALKDVTSTTNARSVIACMVPPVAAGHTLPLIQVEAERSADRSEQQARLLGNLNSTVLDFIARTKILSNHASWYIIEQLPVVPLARYDQLSFGSKSAADIVREAVLELTYTAHDVAGFARDLGHIDAKGSVLPPFLWDEERRMRLRAKLDAVYFNLYGITDRDEVRYIYSTFPIVEAEEVALFGRFRSRDLCLAYMNALAAGHPDTLVEG